MGIIAAGWAVPRVSIATEGKLSRNLRAFEAPLVVKSTWFEPRALQGGGMSRVGEAVRWALGTAGAQGPLRNNRRSDELSGKYLESVEEWTPLFRKHDHDALPRNSEPRGLLVARSPSLRHGHDQLNETTARTARGTAHDSSTAHHAPVFPPFVLPVLPQRNPQVAVAQESAPDDDFSCGPLHTAANDDQPRSNLPGGEANRAQCDAEAVVLKTLPFHDEVIPAAVKLLHESGRARNISLCVGVTSHSDTLHDARCFSKAALSSSVGSLNHCFGSGKPLASR